MLLVRIRNLRSLCGRQFSDQPEQQQKQRQKQRRKPRPSATGASEGPWMIPLIKSCSSEAQLRQLHARILLSAAGRDPAVTAAFLSRAAVKPSENLLGYLRLVFEGIPRPYTPHFNAMIRSYSQSSSPEEAFFLFRDMRRRGVGANPASFSFVLKACNRLRHLTGGKQLHGAIVRNGHQPDSLLLTSLMDVYASCGSTLDAELTFDEMTHRDVVAWNVLISCYAHNGRSKDALLLFDLMQGPRYAMEPDEVTCLLLLQACAHLGALQLGERLHGYIEERGYGGAARLRHSLVAMYSKCGSVEKALAVFRETPEKNVVAWSAIISGLAMNGRGRDALEMFSEMQRDGVAADEQTLTGVLSACSHCGLVDEGLRLFRSMEEKHGLTPNLHHYGCVVDLMGRAGMLDVAYGLIDPARACRIHRHAQLGKRVVLHLVELKAQEAGDLVLLLNMYADAGDWEKVAELRRLMKDRGIQTQPGCSTIESGGKVHEFVADDGDHPRKEEIYQTLEEIGKQLKMAGYMPTVVAELHQSGEEEKAVALSFHSEKLAISFGVLSTPPGATIRVAKNLRTCADCHAFAMAVSAVYNRKIIIRDRSRFHHFREGRCSCNDYW
ncbi:unnamed protein product [Spirodela intermedia]|uniref:DYW domain-containing protein n=1 Tax=Spirodela intermedia TaxID=51605 RepID=A0A7I8J717_SPIIN|nr:unnamed protein product [Spirodela intermedia]CAA6665193.1 unnamed protein product [Spirodela intermedia]